MVVDRCISTIRTLAEPQHRRFVVAGVSIGFVCAFVLLLLAGGPSSGGVPAAPPIATTYSLPGQSCSSPGECTSKVCNNGMCSAPSCRDNVQNGDESDVDCGGYCRVCDNNRKCRFPTDCLSGVCGPRTLDVTPGAQTYCKGSSCSDGVMNGRETDVDCGGPSCPPCGLRKMCQLGTDCADEAQCSSHLCIGPSCYDGIKNEDEVCVRVLRVCCVLRVRVCACVCVYVCMYACVGGRRQLSQWLWSTDGR